MDFIELFAGIGGFRYGLEACNGEQQKGTEAGGCGDSIGGKGFQPDQPSERRNYSCVWSNELDRYASAIYRYNYGEICEGDIKAIKPGDIPDCRLVTFGWPCQDNSIAGQRAGQREGTRSGLLAEALRVLRAKKPDYFIAENVPGLFSVNEGYDFYKTIRLFVAAGYDCQWQVLNTRWFLPQNRERIYFVGHLGGLPRPKVFPIGEADSLYREANGAVACAIDANYGKGWLDHGQRTMVIQAGHRTKGNPRYYEGEIPAITQDYGTGGQNVPMVVTPVLTPDRLKKRQNGRRFKEPGDPMFTLTGQDIHDIEIANAVDVDGYLRTGARPRDENGKPQLLPIGYRRIRRLTPIECERLQGFPDNFTKYGIDINGKQIEISDTQRYKCLGNAVTTLVVKAIGERLINESSYRKG
jgi:DNA (cytosine-5)-methyltransferase 1